MVHFYEPNTDSYLLNASSDILRSYENILLKYFHIVFSYFVLVLHVTMPYKPESSGQTTETIIHINVLDSVGSKRFS